MTSFEPSRAVDSISTAGSRSSSTIHDILNPSEPTALDGASQRTGPISRPPQKETSNHGSSQGSYDQATALHVGSFDLSSSQRTAEYPSTREAYNAAKPESVQFPPISTSLVKSRTSSKETPNFIPQQSSMTREASFSSRPFSTSVAQLPLTSDDAFSSLRIPNSPIPIFLDLESGTISKSEKRKRNAEASVRFRRHRKQRDAGHIERIAALEQEVSYLKKLCDYYLEELKRFYTGVGTEFPASQATQTSD